MKKKLLVLFMRITIHTLIVGSLFYWGSGVVWAIHSDAQVMKDTPVVLPSATELLGFFAAIEKQTDFKFAYEQNLDLHQPLEFSAIDLDLESALVEVSRQANLSFKQINETITVAVRREMLKPVTPPAMDQLITGKVVDENGNPIPGATVLVEGTNLGTATDIEGNFAIDVPPGGVILVSFIGYQSIRVDVGNQSEIQITLSEDESSLEEFVVVGYGTVERRELTGSVASIGRQDIVAEPIYSFENLLQGRAAGVDVVADSYRPGAGSTVRIRGARSLVAGNDPLIVMDGIPIEGNLMDINPSDIESIEILKDASATAIYGSRGSNGVILITTRRGYAGGTQIEYSGFAGLQNMANRVDLMNAERYIEMNREAARHQGTYTTDEALFLDWELEAIERGIDTDWQREAFQTGVQQNHQLSVRGGTEDTRYALSGTYLDHKAIVGNNDFSRFVGRLNLDQDVTKRFRAGVSAQVAYSSEFRGGNFRDLVLRSPLDWPERAEGALTSEFAVGESFPTLALNRDLFIDRRDRTRIITNVYGEIDILEGLSYRFNFAPDLTYFERGNHTWQTSTAGISNSRTSNILYENIINYNKNFGENHKIRATGLYSVQTLRELGSAVSVRGLPFEQQRYHNIGTAEETTGRSSYLNEWALESYMLRVNYNLMDKYMFTLTSRVDGSSRLAEGNKYGIFPSAAFAWLLDQEGFMRGQSFFDELKFRASYGDVGNTGINPFQTQGRVQRIGYAFGDQSVFGFQSAELANTDLRWERTRQVDLGIDFGFFNNRVMGTIGVYQQNTIDLLMNRQLPPTSGFASVLENVGATRNRGFEFNVSTVNFDAKTPGGFRWTTDIVFHSNRNEIIELYGGKEDDPGNRWFIGYPINVYFDWEFAGIWQESDRDLASSFGQQPGDIRLRDINNDGRIDADDRVILGSDVPAWTGSINNRFNYKNFDLSFFIYTTQGITIFSEAGGTSLGGMINLRRGYNLNSRDIDYWTPENPSNEFPRPRVRGHDYSTPMGYFDASFIRVRNITFGYSLPNQLLDRLGVTKTRIYGGVQNPFTFTDFPGLDPEGARNHDMPNYRTFLLGLDLGF
jgi:TonB-linked SusC/RagA family outer membrane protein